MGGNDDVGAADQCQEYNAVQRLHNRLYNFVNRPVEWFRRNTKHHHTTN